MFGLGMTELMVIFGIGMLIFGAKKLPEIGAGLGKGITSFKKGLQEDDGAGKAIADDVSEEGTGTKA